MTFPDFSTIFPDFQKHIKWITVKNLTLKFQPFWFQKYKTPNKEVKDRYISFLNGIDLLTQQAH